MKNEFLKTIQVFSIAGEMLHEKLFHGQVTLTQTPSVNSPQILLALNLTSDSANPPPPPSKELSVSQQDTEIIHHHALSGSSDSTENSSAFDDQEIVEKVDFSFDQQVLDEIANSPDSPVDAAEVSKAEDFTLTHFYAMIYDTRKRQAAINVAEKEEEEPRAFLINNDRSISLKTISNLFPGTIGLKYRDPVSKRLTSLTCSKVEML